MPAPLAILVMGSNRFWGIDFEAGLYPRLESNMLTITGADLTIKDIATVARGGAVRLSDDAEILERIHASSDFIQREVAAGKAIYGVTTLFGGMANHYIPPELAAQLQQNLVYHLSASAGDLLPVEDVRAAMLLRANSLMRGVSGLRLEVLRRVEIFLNANATPQIHPLGSIGASGDLIPLAYMAGALIGMSADYRVNFNGETVDALTALSRLDLKPLALAPKEGLALVNGTSVCAGVAANCLDRARYLMSIAMTVHAIFVQALSGSEHSFDAFIHQHKPHAGQVWVADEMRRLLAGSKMTFEAVHGDIQQRRGGDDSDRGALVQDRYSLRCLPQYLGPLIDGLNRVIRDIETEANSATDNPLIDVINECIHHGGNFLAQYVGIAMDHLRYYLGLLSKHIDVQIALLVEPAFNNGLSPCLVGNEAHRTNLGLKAVQTAGNSIMPLITFHGNSLVDRFPTHAEQFNQNINSQGMGSALLAKKSLDLLEHQLANALLFAVQAADLRAYQVGRHYDGAALLSPATAPVYQAARQALDAPSDGSKPLVYDDRDQFLGRMIAALIDDIKARRHVAETVRQTENTIVFQ